jgi:hypothetical protein
MLESNAIHKFYSQLKHILETQANHLNLNLLNNQIVSKLKKVQLYIWSKRLVENNIDK